ncbi:MAG: galactokinase [Microscillaceae bacterium]|jgi:galactokinase|nr:galactokinase [Microscillaceae bacterium]
MNELQQITTENEGRFKQKFARTASYTAFAPGRINLIGEHTDYNGGLAIPSAINRWVLVSGAKRWDTTVRVYSHNFQELLEFDLFTDYQPLSTWQKYVYGMIKLLDDFAPLQCGFEAYLWGNVPVGAGVSSSAALEVALGNFVRALFHLNLSDIELVKVCQQTDHQYLGVKSGMLDQYASQFSRAGKVMILDCQRLSHQYIPADFGQYTWVLVDSQVKRELANSKYTERVQETRWGLEALQAQFPEIQGFRDIRVEYLPFIQDKMIQNRIKHYVSENIRVDDFSQAIESQDFNLAGKILTASHQSLRDDYEVSCPEIDFLVEQALAQNYVLGSRLMGGGFGGCTINLLENETIAQFGELISKKYQAQFGVQPLVTVYNLVDGAGVY